MSVVPTGHAGRRKELDGPPGIAQKWTRHVLRGSPAATDQRDATPGGGTDSCRQERSGRVDPGQGHLQPEDPWSRGRAGSAAGEIQEGSGRRPMDDRAAEADPPIWHPNHANLGLEAEGAVRLANARLEACGLVLQTELDARPSRRRLAGQP